MHDVKILSHDGKTSVLLDGISIEKRCLGFELKQSGGDLPVLYLSLVCDEVDVSSDSVSVKKTTIIHCQCGRSKHDEDAIYCSNCGGRLEKCDRTCGNKCDCNNACSPAEIMTKAVHSAIGDIAGATQDS